MEGQMKIFHVGFHQFRESLRELLRELWFSYCSSRGMPFREWNFVFREWNFEFRELNFEFRELLREYPGTLPELREWPFHSESVFLEIGGGPQASEKTNLNRRRAVLWSLNRRSEWDLEIKQKGNKKHRKDDNNAKPNASLSAERIRSENSQNESFPNFSNFCPGFCPEFCSEFSPKFLRSSRASFRGKRRPEKIHQKSPPFFNAKFPGKYEKYIHKIYDLHVIASLNVF